MVPLYISGNTRGRGAPLPDGTHLLMFKPDRTAT